MTSWTSFCWENWWVLRGKTHTIPKTVGAELFLLGHSLTLPFIWDAATFQPPNLWWNFSQHGENLGNAAGKYPKRQTPSRRDCKRAGRALSITWLSERHQDHWIGGFDSSNQTFHVLFRFSLGAFHLQKKKIEFPLLSAAHRENVEHKRWNLSICLGGKSIIPDLKVTTLRFPSSFFIAPI